MLRVFGDHVGQALLGFRLIAQEIRLGSTHNSFAASFRQTQEFVQIRLVDGVKLFEALVTCDDEQVVLAFQQGSQFLGGFQRVLSIVFQLITFLTEVNKIYLCDNGCGARGAMDGSKLAPAECLIRMSILHGDKKSYRKFSIFLKKLRKKRK